MSAVLSILTIVGFIIIIVVLQLVLNFFSISYPDYSTYMFWIIALFIFSYILPKRSTYFTG